ncbi:unnamed protein product [Rangifer tarandus platyrhynchus]|uniref:Uncharacterized protein n=1 Tax=Rangifer tarandus platyrhynchus TaxID=3082113 RepID=A0AC59ZU08_RANTA
MDCSPPGSSVRGILQARILEWLPCPPPGDLPDPGIEPEAFLASSALQADSLLLSHQGSPSNVHIEESSFFSVFTFIFFHPLAFNFLYPQITSIGILSNV